MRRNKGFTIVELLVVIVTISILSTIGVVSYGGLLSRSRDEERKADVQNMSSSLELYYQSTGSYPDSATFSSSGFLENTLRVSKQALIAPAGSTSTPLYSYVIGTSSGVSQYGYIAYKGAGSTQCTSATDTCTRYRLSYTTENSGAQTVSSKFGN